jgi:4-aminobutyrate aminotransferase-like enzyme
MMAYGALPLGHAHPRIVEAVTAAAAGGTLFAAATEIEIEVAELLQRLIPGAERVRFANTGTVAAMAAIRLARGFSQADNPPDHWAALSAVRRQMGRANPRPWRQASGQVSLLREPPPSSQARQAR